MTYSGLRRGHSTTERHDVYARLDGPKLWIEISTENAVVADGTHYHSVHREEGSDYGG